MLPNSLSHVGMNEYGHHVPLDCPLDPWMLVSATSKLKEGVTCTHHIMQAKFLLNILISTIKTARGHNLYDTQCF
jgi:hypothetical protein